MTISVGVVRVRSDKDLSITVETPRGTKPECRDEDVSWEVRRWSFEDFSD